MKRDLIFVLVAGILTALPLASRSQEATPEITSEPAAFEARTLEIDLGADFTTAATYTYPSDGDAPFSTVILLHGSGPFDQDATIPAADGSILSQNFKLLAEELAANGIAVLRFNKRGVNANGTYDFAQVQASDLDRLVADAGAVIAAALEQPETDGDRLFVYGWSEGGVVAANVAAQYPHVDGLIMQAAPNGDVASVLPYQHLRLGIPYLTGEIDADGDGSLSVGEIRSIPMGSVANMAYFYMYAPNSSPLAPRINPQTDTNGNGMIEIEAELRPAVEAFIEAYAAAIPDTDATWEVASLLETLEMPILVLHGVMDGWVPIEVVEDFAAASEQVTIRTFDHLGHALSVTEQAAADGFGVMDAAPIAALVEWIGER